MSLYRIHKEANTPFDTYTEHETKLIKLVYLKGKTNDEVNSLLKKCWEEQTWLSFDCQQDYSPIMHVRRIGDDYHIVRMSRYGKHAEECDFSSKPFVKTYSQKHQMTVQKETELRTYLYELIYQAELNQLPLHGRGYGRPLTVQYEHLTGAASAVFGDIYEEYSHLFITHPNGLKACKDLIEKIGKMNPDEPAPVGYLLMMADKINGSTVVLTSKGKDYLIKCQGKCFVEAENYSGPWVGLVSIKKREDDELAVPCDAIFMPAMRKSLLCPLRDEDKKLMDLLLPLQKAAESKNKRILCTKYLPIDDHFHMGLGFNIRSGKRVVDVAIIHTEEGREDLPKGCLYHLQPVDGSTHPSEKFLLEYLSQRLELS
ncbi:MAG: hypothetical protein QM504_11930 [Pseudomonadota bacterium]